MSFYSKTEDTPSPLPRVAGACGMIFRGVRIVRNSVSVCMNLWFGADINTFLSSSLPLSPSSHMSISSPHPLRYLPIQLPADRGGRGQVVSLPVIVVLTCAPRQKTDVVAPVWLAPYCHDADARLESSSFCIFRCPGAAWLDQSSLLFMCLSCFCCCIHS